MKKSTKKKFLIAGSIFLSLFLFYIAWLSFQLLNFKTYKTSPTKLDAKEIEGAYHIHSLFSDGRASVDRIVHWAAQTKLNFIILTDHGRPNYDCLASQGRKEGVLILAGSELSVNRGHLVGLDFGQPPQPFSQIAEEAVCQINSRGGLTIIAHPYSKVSWSWGEFVDYAGLEVINANSMLETNIWPSLPYLPALLLKPQYALLKMLDNPWKNLRKWDELNRPHPIYGYYSIDAHLLYRSLFNLFHLHLNLNRPLVPNFKDASRQIYTTLKKGRFYNAIDGAAEAKGFKFFAKSRDKTEIYPMGAIVKTRFPLSLHIKAPFSLAKEIHLILNGKVILRSQQEEIVYAAKTPGIYRVEVYLKEKSPLGQEIPWILSNPIFLRRKPK
ncbi:MAG: PHP domain-containing protein [Candidatus Aminicenantales bacterium]